MTDADTTVQEKNFETLSREIAVAVREQGDDPAGNYWLSDALRRARSINMPDERIERARAVGTGDADGPDWKETTLEGYGPNGVAVYVELLTDDPRRSAREIEALFEQHGGNLGDDGCVAWQFKRRGVLEVDASDVDDADSFMLEVIEMGGEELEEPVADETSYRIYTDPEDFGSVATALSASGYSVTHSAVDYEATQHVPVDSATVRKFLAFFEKLRQREDVIGAYANWQIA